MPRLRQRDKVLAYLRAIDRTKLVPETMQELLQLRPQFEQLLVRIYHWGRPIRAILDVGALPVEDADTAFATLLLGFHGLVPISTEGSRARTSSKLPANAGGEVCSGAIT